MCEVDKLGQRESKPASQRYKKYQLLSYVAKETV